MGEMNRTDVPEGAPQGGGQGAVEANDPPVPGSRAARSAAQLDGIEADLDTVDAALSALDSDDADTAEALAADLAAAPTAPAAAAAAAGRSAGESVA